MTEGIYTIKYIPTKDSFCYLSEHSSKYLNDGVALRLNYGKHQIAYLSPQVLAGLKETEIGINRFQAQVLGLQEHDSILISVCSHVPGIRRLTVSPASKDDYEILELLAESVESTLLNQIRIVYKNQKFVIWISDSIHVTVNVDSVEPVNPGRLDNLTEVEIIPPTSGITEDFIETNNNLWNLNNLLNYFTKRPQNLDSKSILEKSFDALPLLGFILYPVQDLSGYSHYKSYEGSSRHFNVFVSKDHLPKNFLKINSSNDIFNLKVIVPPIVNNNYIEENNVTIKTVVIRICVLENDFKNKFHIPIMYVHDCIFKHFDVMIGAKVYLDKCIKSYPIINKIEICTTKTNHKNFEEDFKRILNLDNSEDKLVLNSEFVLKGESDFLFSLKFFPSITNYCIIDSDFVRNCKFVCSDSELIVEKVNDLRKTPVGNFLTKYGNVQPIIDDSFDLFQMHINLEPENILITGKPGSGKSTLINILTNRLFSSPFYIHTETISCKTIKGKSLESLHKVFMTKFVNLVYYQPSVLVLDDLHIICEKVPDGDTLTPESLHFNRVSEMLANLLASNLMNNKIAILATSESDLKLNQYIFASRGQHLFKNTFNICELSKDDRSSILTLLFDQKCELENVAVDQLALKTDGFVIQDLVDFVDKAIFESMKEEKAKVSIEHCEVALKNTTALSLKDVQLHSPGDRDFSDIGGLDDVKKVLVECMMWPVQYPNLFGKAPLRLQSGLLLYGPPGTGKTILAGAAAKHCSLRLISIKGPELLSKYIGASEQAVRNVFEKAQSAKPCILFFDEFDSLAPRRGHDSTGVTDRVVNQLLTQLDGIESLNGVCVLAATSRPDLLDPALLRPGRLDRQILCPLPNKEARLKILQSLSQKLVLASDVNLVKIAERTNGFSGADLQAILYTAQLSAVEHLLQEPKSDACEAIQVNRSHLEEALKNTRPSLTKEENLKYKRIYARFQQGADLVDVKAAGQRATLA